MNFEKMTSLVSTAHDLVEAMKGIKSHEDTLPVLFAMDIVHRAEQEILLPKLKNIAVELSVEHPEMLEEAKEKFGEGHPFLKELQDGVAEKKGEPTAKQQSDIDEILRKNFPGMMPGKNNNPS